MKQYIIIFFKKNKGIKIIKRRILKDNLIIFCKFIEKYKDLEASYIYPFLEDKEKIFNSIEDKILLHTFDKNKKVINTEEIKIKELPNSVLAYLSIK